MRALWTASTGMKAQQMSIDVTSNNLANVNTTSFKGQRAQFKDLLYTNMRPSNLNDDGEGRPNSLQVGHGVMPTATSRLFMQGSLDRTDNPMDLAIDGQGFFRILTPEGDIRYTRDGNFKLSIDDGDARIVTSEGYTLLSEDDAEIFIPDDILNITVAENGLITGVNADGDIEELGTIALYDFVNPEGLEATGGNMFNATVASGDGFMIGDENRTGRIRQNYLEASNVQVVDEMVKMITAQRAYETNSKSIQTADEMMGIANNLRR